MNERIKTHSAVPLVVIVLEFTPNQKIRMARTTPALPYRQDKPLEHQILKQNSTDTNTMHIAKQVMLR